MKGSLSWFFGSFINTVRMWFVLQKIESRKRVLLQASNKSSQKLQQMQVLRQRLTAEAEVLDLHRRLDSLGVSGKK